MEELLKMEHKVRWLDKGDALNTPDYVDQQIYFVKSGSLMVYILDDGSEQIVRFGYPGNLIVMLDSYLSEKPTRFRSKALRKSEIWIFQRSTFESYLRSHEQQIWWTKTLENLVCQQIDREIDLLIKSPKERYDRVRHRSPQLFQEIPEKYIANYLRMSPETLSRLKNIDLNQGNTKIH